MQIQTGRKQAMFWLSAAVWLSAAPVFAKVIWRGDFETGTTEQWRGAPKSDAVQIVKDPVREGKFAVRINGTNAARKGQWDRIEFQHQPDPPGTAEGTERYFGWSVFLPKKLTEGVHALGYFETRQSWRQLMSFEVRGEDILYSTRVPYARHWTGKGKLTPGRWHDFAVHVLWSRDPANGFVEVWFDGELVVPRVNTATLLDENVAFFQIGLFRDTIDLPETIIIDHVVEATTLADVTPPQLAEAAQPANPEQPVKPEQPRGPLSALPSKPGPHVAQIEALGDNEWLKLGSPAPDPQWGKARGRSWSSNMPGAADLRGAFVFGEGVHAFVKPDGHYMNDLWFYDINAHRWICLYPGIEVQSITQRIKDKQLTVNELGLLVDKEGQPLPPLLIHAYGYLGYDPDQKQFITFGSQFGNYFTTGKGAVFEQANALFQEQRRDRKFPDLSPFLYDTATGQFRSFAVAQTPGGQPYGANVLAYVRSRQQFFYGGTDGVWFLDRKAKTWQDAHPQGTPPEGIDHCTAYDARRDRIYYYQAGKNAADNFLIYDVRSNAWTKPSATGPGPFMCTSYESIFSFDAATDALVIIRLYQTKDEPGWRRGVYAYDPDTNSWADPLPLSADVVQNIRNGNHGFYDPKLNAYFCHFASDSADDGTMWVYRYRKAKE